jgi:1-acyl-sn-glycerol-3-phosphate acyltransferase
MPVVGRAIRKAGHLTVDRLDLSRSIHDADTVTAALKSGKSLLVFPEGTFALLPGLLPFHLGAFKAAVEARLPVVPIALVGTRQILAGDTWLPRAGRIEVTIGKAIQVEGRGWPEMVRLRDAARTEIARHTGERLVEARPVLTA